ncbi:unnamed protein product [Ranitomeya imitator]|uniref:LRRK2 ANK repeat domain-containing protein n=1 Tax=Ranitomeya imitator TaxID=111125 RepID=A0ABN9KZP2_9NEOB|nr:unnamed protein product [Ranitomeya imitator]
MVLRLVLSIDFLWHIKGLSKRDMASDLNSRQFYIEKVKRHSFASKLCGAPKQWFTPTYWVCEKGTNAKLVELLLNHGVHEQDSRKALEASIKNGNNEVISLLLKKLGLDAANNSICLGGFHMGKIQPSWLNPLFSEKQNALKNPSVDLEANQAAAAMAELSMAQLWGSTERNTALYGSYGAVLNGTQHYMAAMGQY